MKQLLQLGLLTITLAISQSSASQERQPAQKTPDQYGRYVITFSPFARADTFLLDTQTGKVWQLTRFNDVKGDPLVFMNVERIDSDTQFNTWLRSQRLKEESTPSK